MDPYKTMLVCKHNGHKVGRIPATADNAEARIQELVRQHGAITIDYEEDENSGLLAVLMSPRRNYDKA